MQDFLNIENGNSEIEISSFDSDGEVRIRVVEDDVTNSIYLSPKQVEKVIKFMQYHLKEINKIDKQRMTNDQNKIEHKLKKITWVREGDFYVGKINGVRVGDISIDADRLTITAYSNGIRFTMTEMRLNALDAAKKYVYEKVQERAQAEFAEINKLYKK